MKPETVLAAQNPFYTTRTTRSVGLGIPLFKMSAEQTDGKFSLTSRHVDEFPNEHGTEISASFNKKHIDYTPLGDIAESVVTLIQGHPDTDFEFIHKIGEKRVELKTRELRSVLGDVPLNEFEVIVWIREYLTEQYTEQ
jgi:hypothetical protein